MKRYFGALLVTAFLAGPALAADEDPKAVIDKAIKALGGEDKLAKGEGATWKSKGKITFNDNDNDITIEGTTKGLDHYRSEFEGDFNGNTVKGVTVLAGSKGWRKFGDNANEMDADALANEKRTVYLTVVATTVVPLKGKGFKVESAGEEKVGDKPASVLKVTGPDGKGFRLFFDKESGLPVKMTARVAGFQGDEFDQETTYSAYKDFGGVKKATKVVAKRDGQKFIEQEITEFKVLDKVPANTFDEPN